ncbi:amidase [Chloroflexota bacterium]
MIEEAIPSTISEIRQKLTRGELRIDEILEEYQLRIEKKDQILNAFIHLMLDDLGDFNPAKPLSGIPIALKDLIDAKGTPTTAGAAFFQGNIAQVDATIVKKLRKAGAFLIGKTNMHEIALGVTNINSHYGNCLNPWDHERIAGGSSGGSAAAVASGMCIAAVGSDTGGSIRIPSSLCGIVGLKPTYGRVSLNGVIPLSRNLDHVGPMSSCVRDAAIMLEVIAGYDDADPTSVDHPVDDYVSYLETGAEDIKIVFVVGDYVEVSEPEVFNAYKTTANEFKLLGSQIFFKKLPWLKEAALANGIMTTSDAAAVYKEKIEQFSGEFGQDVLTRLLTGRSYTSVDYSLARKTQVEVNRKFSHIFNEFDLLALPTTPVTAPFIEGTDAIEQAHSLTRFTAPFNLAGLPAISIPCGFTTDGLPIGMQLVGDRWNEKLVLAAAYAYERSSRWMEGRAFPGFE